MSLHQVAELHNIAEHFLHSHENCPVEIAISGLACPDYIGACGRLRELNILVQPNDSAVIYVVLSDGHDNETIQVIPDVTSCDPTERLLRFDCNKGTQRSLECLNAHSVSGRDKLLLIRHLALMPQATF